MSSCRTSSSDLSGSMQEFPESIGLNVVSCTRPNLVPIPALLLTKWPQKGGLISLADSLVLVIPSNSGQSDNSLVTCLPKKHVHNSLRGVSCVLVYIMDMPYWDWALFLQRYSMNVLQHLYRASFWFFSLPITSRRWFQLCTRELETFPLWVSHVILVGTWPCSYLIWQNYFGTFSFADHPSGCRPFQKKIGRHIVLI